jgi:hypothetical protein
MLRRGLNYANSLATKAVSLVGKQHGGLNLPPLNWNRLNKSRNTNRQSMETLIQNLRSNLNKKNQQLIKKNQNLNYFRRKGIRNWRTIAYHSISPPIQKLESDLKSCREEFSNLKAKFNARLTGGRPQPPPPPPPPSMPKPPQPRINNTPKKINNKNDFSPEQIAYQKIVAEKKRLAAEKKQQNAKLMHNMKAEMEEKLKNRKGKSESVNQRIPYFNTRPPIKPKNNRNNARIQRSERNIRMRQLMSKRNKTQAEKHQLIQLYQNQINEMTKQSKNG